MQQLLLETQQSYYEYVIKIQDVCQTISHLLKTNNADLAFQLIADLSEGINWIIDVEQHMLANCYIINSRTQEVIEQLHYVNELLEQKDVGKLALLFENKLVPLFASSSEWEFKKLQN